MFFTVNSPKKCISVPSKSITTKISCSFPLIRSFYCRIVWINSTKIDLDIWWPTLDPDALQGWNFVAADVGKKDTEVSIVQQWGKIQPECSSNAGCVAWKGIIAGHVASQSQRKSSSDNLGTAVDVVRRGTIAATALDLLMWILVLQAIWLTKLLVLIQVFIHVVSAYKRGIIDEHAQRERLA